MGTGFGRKRTITRHVQVPSSAKTPRSPSMRRDSQEYFQRPYSSQSSTNLRKNYQHHVQSNSSLGLYAQIWERNGKVKTFFSFSNENKSFRFSYHHNLNN